MSEIKQINTGVAELLAVKVPEGGVTFACPININKKRKWKLITS